MARLIPPHLRARSLPSTNGAMAPSGAAIMAPSPGATNIGTASGLVSWKNGQIQEHVRGRINSVVEDREGRIWIARSRVPDSSGGMCQILGEHPGCIGGDDRMRLSYAESLTADQQGNLWIGGSGQLMRWRDGSFETYLTKELEPSRGLEGTDTV